MNNLLFDITAREIAKILPLSCAEIYEKLEQPPDSMMGDVAFPCFTLAREMKKAPAILAAEMRSQLTEARETSAPSAFEQIKVSGGYLNFYLNKAELMKSFRDIIMSGKLASFPEYVGKKITVEHTSVNPNASPHIGRARNAMIGDAAVRLFRYFGSDVTVHYFVNDIGKQIALLVHCTRDRADVDFNELLSLYVAANEELKVNPEVEKSVFELLNLMENGDASVFADFTRIVGVCIDGQMKIFNEFGIFYDEYDYESRYVRSGKTDDVLALLENTDRLFEDEEGRLVLNLEEFKINSENPFLPLTRRDKTSLYPLRDICYNIDKAREGAYRNIVVLGEDQRLYGKQINAALSLLGVKGAEIINYSFVLLPDGKMSTRAGQVVLLEDLMRDTVAYAKETTAERRGGDSESLSDDIAAKQIAYGAIKYSILKCGNEKNVIFDRETALNFQGDTSVYIQYSYARIQSLLRGESVDVSGNCAAPIHHLEWEIVKKLLSFSQVLSAVASDFNFSSICSYLFELCQQFSRWYRECPIKTADGDVKTARLFLASVIADVIKDGLNILGIEAPPKI